MSRGPISVVDARMDPHDERDLIWRWSFADGQASGLHSSWPDDVVLAVGAQRGVMVATSATGGTTNDVGLRCGPVYVPSGGHSHTTFECDLAGMPAYHRMVRIDAILRETEPSAVALLQLALRDPVPEDLRSLCPVPIYGPHLCNLVEQTLAATREHGRSRSTKPLHAWLARISAKAGGGHPDRRLLLALTMAADALLLWAAGQYALARRFAA